MRSRRYLIQALALAALLGGHFIVPEVQVRPAAAQAARTDDQLPSTNTLTKLAVTRTGDGRWIASIQYSFTGRPIDIRIKVYQVTGLPDGNVPFSDRVAGVIEPRPGHRTSTLELPNPSAGGTFVTRRVWAVMERESGPPPLATVSVDQRIVWQDPRTEQVDKAVAAGQPDAIVAKAVQLIDTGGSNELHQARVLLQRLVEKQPRIEAAYIELARVAMKTGGTAKGWPTPKPC